MAVIELSEIEIRNRGIELSEKEQEENSKSNYTMLTSCVRHKYLIGHLAFLVIEDNGKAGKSISS